MITKNDVFPHFVYFNFAVFTGLLCGVTFYTVIKYTGFELVWWFKK